MQARGPLLCAEMCMHRLFLPLCSFLQFPFSRNRAPQHEKSSPQRELFSFGSLPMAGSFPRCTGSMHALVHAVCMKAVHAYIIAGICQPCWPGQKKGRNRGRNLFIWFTLFILKKRESVNCLGLFQSHYKILLLHGIIADYL